MVARMCCRSSIRNSVSESLRSRTIGWGMKTVLEVSAEKSATETVSSSCIWIMAGLFFPSVVNRSGVRNDFIVWNREYMVDATLSVSIGIVVGLQACSHERYAVDCQHEIAVGL